MTLPILPPPLKPGDTIAFYTPSSPATHYAPTRFERAKSFLASKGYNLKAGTLTGESDSYRSGSIQARADELNDLIHDESVRCIMSTIGGANSNSLLPYIDYEHIRKDPKIFVGYSDVTAIQLAILTQANLSTFYGPAAVASFGELPPLVDRTFDSFYQVATNQQRPLKIEQPEYWSEEFLDWENQSRSKTLQPNQVDFLGTGQIGGRLIGGNLNTMLAIWGSPYMPTILPGDILLLEDSLKDISTVERLFAFLKINGVFDLVGAIILGKHELFDDKDTGRTPLDVLNEVLNGQQVPIVNGFDCAHTHPMITLPLGVPVEIDFDRGQVSLI